MNIHTQRSTEQPTHCSVAVWSCLHT